MSGSMAAAAVPAIMPEAKKWRRRTGILPSWQMVQLRTQAVHCGEYLSGIRPLREVDVDQAPTHNALAVEVSPKRHPACWVSLSPPMRIAAYHQYVGHFTSSEAAHNAEGPQGRQ